MDIILEALLETPVGAIILGLILITALLIQFFNNKPKI